MHIYQKIEGEICQIITDLSKAGTLNAEPETLKLDKVEASPPRDASHGDIATNAAMVLAPQLKQKPRDVAEILAQQLRKQEGIEKVDVAGPGFINLTLSPSIWQQAVGNIITSGVGYGDSDIGKSEKVNIEFVSANPTGPMHVGHGRGAVYGDALATLMQKAGYQVTREYYVNDAGAQVDKLAESAYLRYQQACGKEITEIPEGLYPGDYLIPVGEALKTTYDKKLMEMPQSEWLPIVSDFTIDAVMQMVRGDLAVLGIKHDVFTSERSITASGKVEEAIKALEDKGLIYKGVLEPPKGKTPDDWEPREQTLFKSTDFGDDCDRAIKKSDGSWTYFAPDIAYHYDKYQRGFSLLIDVFGADHGGYVKRLKAVLKALSGGSATLDVKLCQLVKFMRDGVPAKMSKRAGTFVTVREVVDEVGKDVFRYIMLTRKNDVPLDFDFAEVTALKKENPVFYVQYAHARAHSVQRIAAQEMPKAIALADSMSPELLSQLTQPQELALIRMLCNWPRLVEQAARSLEPHRIAFYLGDVAAEFHGLWNMGNDDLGLRFLVKDDIKLTAARMCLARALATVIASGLTVLGVEPKEEMR